MALDPTIALQAQPPSFDTALRPIASLLGLQGAALNLKRAQATYDSDVAQRQAESQSAQTRAKLEQANLQPQIEQQAAATDLAKTQAKGAQFRLTGEQFDRAAQIASGLTTDPDINSGDPTKIIPKLTAAKQRMIEAGVPEQTAEVQAAHLISIAAQHPDKVPEVLKNSILQSMTPVQQAVAIKPDVVQNDTGREIVSNNFNPLAQGGIGSQPIAPIQKQLPPNTLVYNPKTQAREYLGSENNPDERGFDPTKLSPEQKAAMIRNDPVAYANGLESFYKRGQQHAPLMAEAPIGAEAAVTGSQGTINDQWKTLNDQASRAGTDISLLQNIKQFSHNAVTGQLADRESLINGIAARLGMSAADLKKTDTDLLAKNSAMLALVGGNTDAARALAEAANPNIKMNETAIRHAADQIISQKQMAIAQQQFLLPYKRLADQGHPEAYQAAKAQFDAAADPRIFQYPNMTQEEKFRMKNSMSPAEQEAFREKAAKLKALGVIQ